MRRDPERDQGDRAHGRSAAVGGRGYAITYTRPPGESPAVAEKKDARCRPATAAAAGCEGGTDRVATGGGGEGRAEKGCEGPSTENSAYATRVRIRFRPIGTAGRIVVGWHSPPPRARRDAC